VRLAAAAIAIVVSAGPIDLFAAPAHEALFFDAIGRKAYAKGEYDRALELFLFARAAAPSPYLAYNIAVCADLAGHTEQAFTFFEEYLGSSDPDPARRTEGERRLEALKKKVAVLEVRSDPPGATIYIGGRELGQHGKAPRRVPLEPGSHRVLLELEGHLPFSEEVSIELGESKKIAAAMVPKHGTLVIRTVPPEGEVIVRRKGEEKARAAPGQMISLPVGRYAALVSAPGYEPVEVDTYVRETAVESREVILKKLPPKVGRLLVSSGEVGARVFIDGRLAAETPARLDRVEVGRHEVEVRADGHVSWTGVVEVVEGKSAYVNATLLQSE
jgi:hypothetical protein